MNRRQFVNNIGLLTARGSVAKGKFTRAEPESWKGLKVGIISDPQWLVGSWQRLHEW